MIIRRYDTDPSRRWMYFVREGVGGFVSSLEYAHLAAIDELLMETVQRATAAARKSRTKGLTAFSSNTNKS